MLRLKESNIDYTIYFYNPNIHPREEYLLRKNENLEFARKHKISFIDDDYDTRNWFDQTKGQEWEPERGKRCSTCFDMRFLKTGHIIGEKIMAPKTCYLYQNRRTFICRNIAAVSIL